MDKQKLTDPISIFPNSYWLSHKTRSFPTFTADTHSEIAIIGGGIVGIMTAYLLAKSGKQITLIEAKEFLSGTTRHTTAKISAQHGLIYDKLIQSFGKKAAKLYYEANNEGCRLIQEIAQNLGIKCGFEKRDAVVFASSEKYVQKFKQKLALMKA